MSYQPATLTTRGDLLDAGASGIWQRLALGSTNQVLTSNGTDVAWAASPASAGGALTQIAQSVLSGSAASITFSSIPGSYSNLMVLWQARSDTTGGSIVLQLNADTSASYDFAGLDNGTGAVTAFGSTGQTSLRVGVVAGTDSSSGVANSGQIIIPNYAGTTFQKTLEALCTRYDLSTIKSEPCAGRYNSTSAITALKLFPSSGNFISATTVTLYGLS